MRTLVTACAIYRGKVIATPIIRIVPLDYVPDAQLGAIMRLCMDEARKLGYHMADPDMYIRVEYKSVP